MSTTTQKMSTKEEPEKRRKYIKKEIHHTLLYNNFEVTYKGEKYKFGTRKEITDKFDIPRASINLIVNEIKELGTLNPNRKKWRDFHIVKIKEEKCIIE